MFCKKCGKEINDESVYCNFCGEKQNGSNDTIKKRDFLKIIRTKGFIFGITGLFFVIIVFISIQLMSNPVSKFLKAVEESKYTEAITLYDEKIKGNLEKEKEIIGKLENQIQEVSNKFKNKTIDYDKSLATLGSIRKTNLLGNEVNKTVEEIEELHLSRVAYKKGLEFKNSKNYADAVTELNKVIEVDVDYNIAQEEIKSITKEYKNDIITRSETNIITGEYEEALKLISSALKVIPNDADLLAKEASYKKSSDEKKQEERRLKMEELKENQEVEVVSASQYTNSINTNFISVKVKNNTEDKRVKSYSIGFMGFDAQGLPVKVGLGGGEFVGRGRGDQNILPNKTVDSGGGWYLDNHDIKTLIACISQVEYYEDNEVWKNPYYDLWLQEYQEKPLN